MALPLRTSPPVDPAAEMAALRAKLAAPPKPGAWSGGVVYMRAVTAARFVGIDRVTLWKWLRAGRVLGATTHGRLRPTWRIPIEWCRAAKATLDAHGDLVAAGVLAPVRLGEPPDDAEATSEPPEGADAA